MYQARQWLYARTKQGFGYLHLPIGVAVRRRWPPLGLVRPLTLLWQFNEFEREENHMALTKDQLIADIAEAVDAPKATAKNALEQLGQIVADQLENGQEITLPGIGKLKVTERPARTGRNPSTGAAIEIAAKKVVKFVPAKVLADAINK